MSINISLRQQKGALMIFVFDDSFDGYLCCVYAGFKTQRPTSIIALRHHQSALFGAVRHIDTDRTRAKRVANGLRMRLGTYAYRQCYYAFLSEDARIPDHLFNFTEKFLQGKCTLHTLQNPDVHMISTTAQKVSRQRHRFLGLMRFQEISGVLYAHFEPEYDLLETLPTFFMNRLPNERLVIHDQQRKKIALCFQGHYHIVADTLCDVFPLKTGDEDLFTELWKVFFNNTAQEDRLNLSLQRAHMPRKLWSHLPEKMRQKLVPVSSAIPATPNLLRLGPGPPGLSGSLR